MPIFVSVKSYSFFSNGPASFGILTVMRKKVFVALRMSAIAGQEKLAGIFRHLGERHDWEMTLVRAASEFTPARVRAALKEGFDGFIVSIPDTERAAACLAKSSVPTVVMDIHDPGLSARKSNILFIRNSAEAIGSAAALELLGTGACRSYAFVHNPLVAEWSRLRLKAFRETLRDHGFWCHELSDPEGIGKLDQPVGVLAANDDRGFDILEYCHAHRLKVPRDVLVLGINNDALICENCRPGLSSVQPDYEQEGFLAAQELNRMMSRKRKAAARTIFVGVRQIVRRESTAPQSQSGMLVPKAISYMSRNARRGISVTDVVRHLKCSRRLADLRFRQLQGSSIGEYIIGLQLEEAKRLLRDTREPISAIASCCGYTNASHLMTLFRKRFGITMGTYRRQMSAH